MKLLLKGVSQMIDSIQDWSAHMQAETLPAWPQGFLSGQILIREGFEVSFCLFDTETEAHIKMVNS